MATRNGSAEWKGDLPSGSGQLTVGDGVFTGAYSFSSRFEEGEGTNPEELIGAAQAACYSMQLSAMLAGDGHTPDSVDTTAKVDLHMVDEVPTITKIAISTEGKVPGIDAGTFDDYAKKAKEACLVSRALGGVNEITLSSKLAS